MQGGGVGGELERQALRLPPHPRHRTIERGLTSTGQTGLTSTDRARTVKPHNLMSAFAGGRASQPDVIAGRSSLTT